MLDPQVVILAWIPVVVLFFSVWPAPRALIVGYVVGMLALPAAAIPLEGFWDIDGLRATNIGVFLGMLFFRMRDLRAYRFHPADLWLTLFCVLPLWTSMSNGLGAYDGLSEVGRHALDYLVPFVLGRVALGSEKVLDDAGRFVVGAAGIYAVLAVWEWRMSPQIHNTLYGFFQNINFVLHHRWGFFRPIVCFPKALSLGIFFAWTSVLAVALYKARRLSRVVMVPPQVLVGLPIAGLFVCLSFGPWASFLLGSAMVMAGRTRGRRWIVALPILAAVIWMGGRITGLLTDRQIGTITNAVAFFNQDRGQSFEYRVNAETLVIDHAKERLWLGWGAWDRGRVTDENDADVALDGLWVILLGTNGVLGLGAFFLWWCWPIVDWVRVSRHATFEPATIGFVIGASIFVIFFLFNAFLNPVLILVMGGITGVLREAKLAPAPRIVPACAGVHMTRAFVSDGYGSGR